MRIRPWPIVILAGAQILAPIANIFYSAWLIKVTPLRYLVLNFGHDQWQMAGSLSFFLGFPIAGIAIYKCNRWSYPIFLAVMLWAFGSNFETWRHYGQYFSLHAFVLANVINFGLVSYFLIPSVREVYFNPRLRWWEAKPRYDCSFTAQLLGKSGIVTNISEGGIFVETDAKVEIGKEVQVAYHAEKDFSADAKVVRVREAAPRGCGLQFIHTPESLQAVRAQLKSLRESGACERQGNVNLLQEFKSWFMTAMTTGRGLVPPSGSR